METMRKAQTLDLLSKQKRIDGRALDQYRPISIRTGLIQKANGSSEVSIGNSKVLAGVKIQTGAPFPDTPNQGLLVVNTEFLPLSSARIEPGPPDEDSIELSRVVDRGIRESQMIDLKALVIEPGKSVYCVFVDIDVLNMDGNLFDTLSMSATTAIASAKFDKKIIKEDGTEEIQKVPLPVRLIPVSVTSIIIGDNIILDPTEEEESLFDVRLTLVFNEEGNLTAGQKGGPIGISREQLSKIVDISRVKAEEIRSIVKKAVENA